MGKSFNVFDWAAAVKVYERDEARVNRRAARETWVERGNAIGEGTKRTDSRTGLTMRGDK